MKLATTILVFCVSALLALGLVMLYSSSMADKGAPLTTQLIWCALGLVVCMGTAALDYVWLKKLVWPVFGVVSVLLILVLVPHMGMRINGARRWLKVPHTGFGFEPSELAKLALILVVAWYGDRYQRYMKTFWQGIAIPCVFIGFMLGLIFLEPDWGTTLLLATVSGMLLLIAGVRWQYFAPPVMLSMAGLGLFLWHNPVRIKRIFAWLNLDEHKMDIGYQSHQALLALGAGGWFGLGLGNSRQKLGFLPEHDSDFIFSIIGEELGLIATLLVVLAFVLVVVAGIYIASQSRSNFGLLLGSGISFLIGLQALINIGVVTNTLPNKGLPLPFISRGGSSLFVMLTCVGVLLSIARHGRGEESAPVGTLEEAGTAVPQPT